MKVINYLNQLFRKKQTSTKLAKLQDLINIPKREDYINNKTCIIKIDIYKKEYLELLKIDKTITTVDLRKNSYQEDLNTNINLLLILFNKIEEMYPILNRSQEQILYLKLKLYLTEIITINNETKLRYIALRELTNELFSQVKIKYLINRKNTINEELNNIESNLLIFEMQKRALNFETNISLEKIKSNKCIEEENSKIITKRYKKLMHLAENKIPNKKYNMIKEIDNEKIAIAYLEYELEHYAYKNQNNIEELSNRLEEIKTIPRLSSNREKIIDLIADLEKDIVIHYEFDNEEKMEDILYDLYELKFSILIIGIEQLYTSPFIEIYNNSLIDIEFFIYEQIIMEKINNVITNKNEVLTKQFDIITKEKITIIAELFKKENKYKPEEILRHNLTLAMLIYLESGTNIAHLLDKYFMEKTYFIKMLETNDFSLEKYLPLKTILTLEITFNDYLRNINSFYMHTIKSELKKVANIYKILKIKLIQFEHWIPDGIIKMSGYYNEEKKSQQLTDLLFKFIADNCNGHFVFAPESLKSLNPRVFMGHQLRMLDLNEGLEKASGADKDLAANDLVKSKEKQLQVEVIIIPSTLKNIDDNIIDFNYTTTLYFRNYKKSLVLNNANLFQKLFKNMFDLTSYIKKFPYDFPQSIYYYYIWQPKVSKINLCDEYGAIDYTIDMNRFSQTMHFYRINSLSIHQNILVESNIKDFIKYVEKQTGYKLCSKGIDKTSENKLSLKRD